MVVYSVLGFTAATLAPLAMTFGFIIWGKSWQGSAYALNVFKCSLAGFVFMIVAFSFPSGGSPGIYSQSMVVLSSVIGIIIGDNTWLMALQIIGAKRVIVIDALKPFCAAFVAYFILDEPLTLKICIGVLVSSLGVVMVSTETPITVVAKEDLTEKPENSHSTELSGTSQNVDNTTTDTTTSISSSTMLWGYILAAINVILDAFGSVLTKQFGTEMNTWEINLLRFGFAAIIMGSISLIMLSYEHFMLSKWTKFQELSESMHALNTIVDIENVDQSNEDRMNKIEETIEVQSVIHQDSYSSYSNTTGTCSRDNGNFSRLGMEDSQSEYDSEIIDNTGNNTSISSTNSSSTTTSRWYSFPTTKEMSRIQWVQVALGVMFVTFLCPAMSNYALFQLPLSLCLTLNSLGPVYSIPLVYIMLSERSGWQSIVGSVLAVGGIAIMCL